MRSHEIMLLTFSKLASWLRSQDEDFLECYEIYLDKNKYHKNKHPDYRGLTFEESGVIGIFNAYLEKILSTLIPARININHIDPEHGSFVHECHFIWDSDHSDDHNVKCDCGAGDYYIVPKILYTEDHNNNDENMIKWICDRINWIYILHGGLSINEKLIDSILKDMNRKTLTFADNDSNGKIALLRVENYSPDSHHSHSVVSQHCNYLDRELIDYCNCLECQADCNKSYHIGKIIKTY